MDQDPWSEAVAGPSSGFDPIVEAGGYQFPDISNPPPKGNTKGKQFFSSKIFTFCVEHRYIHKYIYH